MIELDYDPNSFAGPIDPMVVDWLERHRQPLDRSYLEHASRFHGGVPGKQYFVASDGKTRRVGRFLTLVDEKSTLEPPFRQSWHFPERDIRIDWSVVTLIDEEGPSCRQLFAAERLLPFAALYRGQLHPDEWSPREGDCDLLCFDYRSDGGRPGIVVWDAAKSFDEYVRWDKYVGGERAGGEVRYDDFTIPVARDFDQFLRMLRREPEGDGA